jgi:hypothetical protein
MTSKQGGAMRADEPSRGDRPHGDTRCAAPLHAEPIDLIRRRVTFTLGLTASGALTACAGVESKGSGRAADAPAYRVGDRWLYRARDGFNRLITTWDETHTISAVNADGITERVTLKGPTLDVARSELWTAPGQVKVGALYEWETRRFATPLDRYRFPLAAGATWSQYVNNVDESNRTSGQINYYLRVQGWETVATPAGVFDALLLHVVIWLDDETFWRFPTQCNYILWYAPAVRGIAREIKRASYQEKGGDMDAAARIPTQNTFIELVSFTPGA